jgi:hypothetical protein
MELSASTVAILLFVAGLMWLVPRRYMIAPYILTACLIPASEEIVILGFNFQPARVLVLIGMVRALLGEAARQYRFVPLDGLILLWGFNLAAVSILREPTMQMFVRQTGVLYEIFGMYFLARLTIQSRAQVHVALTTLAVCALVSLPLGHPRGRHAAAAAGDHLPDARRLRPPAREQGARLQRVPPGHRLRQLHVRLGRTALGAMALDHGPAGDARPGRNARRHRLRHPVQLGNDAEHAHGGDVRHPALLLSAGRSLCRLGRALFMASYHFFWPGGQWWGLVARASSIVGGSGFHRAELIKQFWLRIDEWALKGSEDVTHWNIVGDPANHWVTEGLKGGLLGLILFTAVVVMCFIVVGRALKATPARRDQALFWAIGCGMFAFCVSFIGLANFGQINVLWFGLIGMIGSVSESLRVQRSTRRMPAAGPHSPHPARPMHAPPGPPPPPTERTGVAYD